jgi:uridine phosphorylase
VRIGSCGALDPGLRFGDLVVVQAAARGDGTPDHYAPAGFPAVADIDVVQALRGAAVAAGHRFRVGVVLTNDAFYAEMAPETFPMEGIIRARWDAWARAGCIAAEMETATVLIVAAVRRVRAGAVLAVIDSASEGVPGLPDPGRLPIDAAIDTAVGGLRRLIALDAAAGGSGSAAADR